MKLTEKQVIAALERLAKGWPDNLWLYSASGTLHLMRKDEDGQRMLTENSGMDDTAIIYSTLAIENDGGDW